MKLQGIGVAVWLTWILTASAQTVLPEAVPGSFAPVPAKITAGPLLPAEPMEATALAFGDCSNAGALLKNLRIQLSEEQIKLFDAQRFLLIPIEATALAEALQ